MNDLDKAVEAVEGVCEQMDVCLPVAFTVKQQQSFAADLRLLLSVLHQRGEALTEAQTVINDLLMPIPHTESSRQARQRAADYLSRQALSNTTGSRGVE